MEPLAVNYHQLRVANSPNGIVDHVQLNSVTKFFQKLHTISHKMFSVTCLDLL